MGEKIAEKQGEIEGKEWVLVSHGDYFGGARQLNPLEPGTYMPLSRKDLSRFKPRRVFLGHIHKPFNQDNVYYAGSPCGLAIDETGKRRFLLFDTNDWSVESRFVATDVLYFDESFVVVPMEDEVSILREQIKGRIESWGVEVSDYPRVRLRVKAVGYAMNRNAVRSELDEGFGTFTYYENESPNIDGLLVGSDPQLKAIAERTMTLIDALDWDFGGDEPAREQVKIAALAVIYGDRGNR
jgi:hypothetical protein